MTIRSKRSRRPLFPRIYMVLINIFFFLPILAVIMGSINANDSNTSFTGFTAQWYVTLLQDASLQRSLWNTLVLAALSTALTVFLGTLAAFGLYRFRFRGKSVIESLFYIPIVIPEVVLGISLMTIFSVAKIPTGLLTLVLAHTTFCIPYMVFNVKASIAGMDPAMEEASMDLGATPRETFVKITMPQIIPGIISGAFMSFTLSIDDVIVSYFTNGPGYITLPIAIWGMTKRGIHPDVYALATLIMALVVLLMLLSQLPVKHLLHKCRRRIQKSSNREEVE